MRGETRSYILFREILPNSLPPLPRRGVDALLLLHLPGRVAGLPRPRRAAAVAGLGPADQRSANFFTVAPWVLLFPACTIAVLVISTNLMSDGLRQVMLPGGGRNDDGHDGSFADAARGDRGRLAPRSSRSRACTSTTPPSSVSSTRCATSRSPSTSMRASASWASPAPASRRSPWARSATWRRTGVSRGQRPPQRRGTARTLPKGAARPLGLGHRRGLPEPSERAQPLHRQSASSLPRWRASTSAWTRPRRAAASRRCSPRSRCPIPTR